MGGDRSKAVAGGGRAQLDAWRVLGTIGAEERVRHAELAGLRAFFAVARAGTLAAAGEELHLTPSALSKALRRLEAALGVELFDRDGFRLRLNASGERFRPQAQRLADLANGVR